MALDWQRYWWQPGFVVALLSIGVPYWLIPYSKLNLPDGVLGIGLAFLFVATVLARIYSGRSLFRVIAVLGSVVPAVVMLRVAADVARDPTSHNLWPFELVIALIVGAAVTVGGALLGSAGLWLSGRAATPRK